jgi:hypothetical protein
MYLFRFAHSWFGEKTTVRKANEKEERMYAEEERDN